MKTIYVLWYKALSGVLLIPALLMLIASYILSFLRLRKLNSKLIVKLLALCNVGLSFERRAIELREK